MSCRFAAKLALGAAFLVAPTGADLAAAPAAIDVRLNGGVAPEVVEAIARLGEPSLVTLPPNSNFRQVVIQRCGGVDPAYVAAFLRENAPLEAQDLDRPIGGRTYTFPACARSPAFAPRTLSRGELIESLFQAVRMPIDAQALERAGGGAGPDPAPLPFACLGRGLGTNQTARVSCSAEQFATAENTRRFVAANPAVDPRRVIGGLTEVQVPGEAIWSTIVLRQNISVAEALNSIQRAASGTGRRAAVDVDEAQVATLIADEPIQGSCTAATTDWPFSPAELERALTTNRQIRPADAFYRRSRILVLDTGFDDNFLDRAVPRNYLGQARAPGLSSGPILYSGVNLATSQVHARPPAGLPNRLHGSEVAATLLGGSLLEPRRAVLSLPVQLIFASIATTTTSGTYLSNIHITEALKYARRNSIPIINGSVSATANPQQFRDGLTAAGLDVLLVTAAGNNGAPFMAHDLSWPGGLGGRFTNAEGSLIVTVGSHDSSGQISSFSRRGALQVDLLAPGCEIPTFSLNNDGAGPGIETAPRTGTSYAAPIISLMAAYMYAEGLEPADIKARLLTSVDVDLALQGDVYSVGRLNVTKALSVWQDVAYVLGPPDGDGARQVRRVAGRLQSSAQPVQVCSNTILQEDLRKLSVASNSRNPQAPRRIITWWSDPNQEDYKIERAICDVSELEGENILILEPGASDPVSIPLTDIVDFISRSL